MTGIGERINARRKELGMTQEELSKKLGYKNKSTISQIENGVNDIMQSKVASFAEALNTTVAYLVGLEEPTQPKKNASGMKYAKIREIRNQLERCRYVVMSAEAKIKRVRSDIAAEYAYKALVSVAEMSKQYNTIIELLNNIAISEHGNTHEQTE